MPRPQNNAFQAGAQQMFKRISNHRRNQIAYQKMSTAEKYTGLTAAELTEVQRRLKEDLYKRMAA